MTNRAKNKAIRIRIKITANNRVKKITYKKKKKMKKMRKKTMKMMKNNLINHENRLVEIYLKKARTSFHNLTHKKIPTYKRVSRKSTEKSKFNYQKSHSQNKKFKS